MAAVLFLLRLFCQMCLVLERTVRLHFITLTAKTPQTINKRCQERKSYIQLLTTTLGQMMAPKLISVREDCLTY